MTDPEYRLRTGTVHGVKHVQYKMNNQDAVLIMEFGVPSWNKKFRMGIVSDGCSGIPAFTKSETGANLLTVFCLARMQELIVGGAKMEEIPLPLYHAVTNFMRTVTNLVMPANIVWPFPITFVGDHAFRNTMKASERFKIDYLSATILGFVDDGTTLVTFQAGDGVQIVDDRILIVDQNDQPEYPALSVNSPGSGFAVATYVSAEVSRLALTTDGLEPLLARPELGLSERLFSHAANNALGLRFLLDGLVKEYPELMGDDCTVLTRERFQEVNNGDL